MPQPQETRGAKAMFISVDLTSCRFFVFVLLCSSFVCSPPFQFTHLLPRSASAPHPIRRVSSSFPLHLHFTFPHTSFVSRPSTLLRLGSIKTTHRHHGRPTLERFLASASHRLRFPLLTSHTTNNP
ncbi:hypothetical protein DENSPDRAFT_317974 [Dentipellis sp. KUC8613]|nr:hypothetical protein DENSPDRAFT_317974 [Dentipellis sp. KUC8613]